MSDLWKEAMLDGEFERAWQISDAVLRQRAGQSCEHLPHHQRWLWDGTPLVGRRVRVSSYHGLGDTLQFIRFVPRLAAVAESVIIETQPALLPLLRLVCPDTRLLPLGGSLPTHDVAIELMELPHAFRLTANELPGPFPYLHAPVPPSQTAAGRLRVGLVWAGGDWRSERSLRPELLLPLTRLPVDLVALQIGPARIDPQAALLLGACCEMLPSTPTIVETAAVIGGLDLVITIDTMAAHLAGALGRPVWTLLDAEADWRWMRHRSDTPWYPTMRLFRQRDAGDWPPVLEQVATELTQQTQRAQAGTGRNATLLNGRVPHHKGIRPMAAHDTAEARTTTDHDEIRKWAEARGGKPAAVKATHRGKDAGIIRLMFPKAPNHNDDALEEISWDEFFAKFDEAGLAFLHQDTRAGGEKSLFNKLVDRDAAEKDDGKRHSSQHKR